MTPTPPTATDSSTLLARGSLLSQRQQLVPKAAASAIKCNVIDSQRELCRLLVVPFAPKRGKREIFIDEELQERREEVE